VHEYLLKTAAEEMLEYAAVGYQTQQTKGYFGVSYSGQDPSQFKTKWWCCRTAGRFSLRRQLPHPAPVSALSSSSGRPASVQCTHPHPNLLCRHLLPTGRGTVSGSNPTGSANYRRQHSQRPRVNGNDARGGTGFGPGRSTEGK
jgi:hypothetical protein